MILGIYGSGGVGREAKEIAELQGIWSEIIFIDDTVPGDIFKGIKRMPFEEFKERYSPEVAKVIIAMGEPKYKIMIFHRVKEFGYTLANVIHPLVYVSPDAKLGEGIIAQLGCMIAVDSMIGDNVTLEQYVVVSHDSIISDHVQISAFVVVGGHSKIGTGTYIGISTSIRDRVEIGEDCIIGMGTVVHKNIPNNVIAMGVPVRVIKEKGDHKVFNQESSC